MPAPGDASSRFWWGLGAICAGALVARVAYVLAVARTLPVVGDAETYHLLGRVLADGEGYVRPRELLATGVAVPTAEFPPLHAVVLALADLLGLDTPNRQRMVGALLGVATVALIGLLGRRIGGNRVGLLAAGLAAVSPVLIEHDAGLQAEGLFALLVTASLLAIHVVMSRPSRWTDLVLLGLLLGATALTRSEGLLLVPVAAVLVAKPSGRSTLVALGLVAAGAILVIGTWTVRNTIELDGVVLTSTNASTVVAGANCDAVYDGYQKGLWRLDCVRAVDVTGLEDDEAARSRRWLRAGIDYARDHAIEVPAVASIRVLRTFGLWDPGGQVAWESLEGRDRDWHTWAQRAHWLVFGLAVAGFVMLRHRWRELVLLLAPVAAAVVVSALSAGNTRFRAGADPALLVAAAVALDAVARRWIRAR